LPPDRILPSAKFTVRPLTFSYISSVTARHSSSGRQPNSAAWYKEWNYRTFAEGATYIRQGGHHVGHRPTFYFLSFFLAYSQPSQIGCLPYFHTSCGLPANLECRSEKLMCCMRLAEIGLQDAKIAKSSASAHHRTTLSGYIFTAKACIDNRKKGC